MYASAVVNLCLAISADCDYLYDTTNVNASCNMGKHPGLPLKTWDRLSRHR